MDKKVFSIIIAVYNVELFLGETLESLINQTIDKKKIQVILVDDGSTDRSGEICDQFAMQYPDLIEVIHKENGGAASARNIGIKHATGKYLNFLDADDKLDLNVLEKIEAFFSEHYDEVDVVSIPMMFFDATSGKHILNYKYNQGSRVIDLQEEYNCIQLSAPSSFVKYESVKDRQFDPKLKYAEDTKLMVEILCDKQKLGVVSEGVYWYRRRSEGEASAIQKSGTTADWYIPYLENFAEAVFAMCKNKMSFIPKFVQYTVMYDLQWKYKMKDRPDDVLGENTDIYLSKLFGLLKQIDYDVILRQQHISAVMKIYLLSRKYECNILSNEFLNDCDLDLKDQLIALISKKTSIDFLDVYSDHFVIEGNYIESKLEECEFEIWIRDDKGISYKTDISKRRNGVFSVGEEIAHYYEFIADIPLKNQKNTYTIELKIDNQDYVFTDIGYGGFAPLSAKYNSSYYSKSGWILSKREKGKIQINKYNLGSLIYHELRFIVELFFKRQEGGKKSVLARAMYHILHPFKKGIWLVSDRTSKAGDNGEALFRYLNSEHPEIKSYYIINKTAPDYKRMKQIGRVVDNLSFKHKLLFLLSEYNISSSAEHITINPFAGHDGGYKDILHEKKNVFLQHGITKDDISSWLERYNKNLYGFVTAAEPEYLSIVNGNYSYPEERIWLTGFPRFDYLYHDEDKVITIMPTWRKYDMSDILDNKTSSRMPKADFKERPYYLFYNSLINSEKLIDAAREYGYKICFFPHPNIQQCIDLFDRNEQVEFLPANTEYRVVYAKSKLVLTDYSSAVFDFAYLRKPVVYSQFDKEQFFGGGHAYTKGYFDYERDGFGEVKYDLDSTIDCLIDYMKNDCVLKDEYRKRIDEFFTFNDQSNCERVYLKLKNGNPSDLSKSK